jgi:DNA-binding Xre family transcriptional regulator
MSNVKFNAARFKVLIQNKLNEKGISNRSFIKVNKFSRSPFTKALAGDTRPSLANLNRWCKALECTPEERAEIIASVYIEEEEPIHQAPAA